MRLNKFALKVERGELSLRDAINYFRCSYKEIPSLKNDDDDDLLQIAIKNNYKNLFNEIIKEADSNIKLLDRFDLFRRDNDGFSSLNYAIVNNKEMFYRLIAESKNKEIENMKLRAPRSGRIINIIDYLLKVYIDTPKFNVELNKAIMNLLGKGSIIDKIDESNLKWLIINSLQNTAQGASQFLNLIIANSSNTKALDIWRFTIDTIFDDRDLDDLPQNYINNSLDFLSKILNKGITVSSDDMEKLKRIRNYVQRVKEKSERNAKKLNVNPSDSDEFKEMLRKKNYSQVSSSDIYNLRLKKQNDDVNVDDLVEKFRNEGIDALELDDEGHTIFKRLSSVQIVKIFEQITPELTNEAIYDITTKCIISDFKHDTSHSEGIEKVYRAVYDYIPTEDVEAYCRKMLGKAKFPKPESFFDLKNELMKQYPGVTMIIQGSPNYGYFDEEMGYIERLELIRSGNITNEDEFSGGADGRGRR